MLVAIVQPLSYYIYSIYRSAEWRSYGTLSAGAFKFLPFPNYRNLIRSFTVPPPHCLGPIDPFFRFRPSPHGPSRLRFVLIRSIIILPSLPATLHPFILHPNSSLPLPHLHPHPLRDFRIRGGGWWWSEWHGYDNGKLFWSGFSGLSVNFMDYQLIQSDPIISLDLTNN